MNKQILVLFLLKTSLIFFFSCKNSNTSNENLSVKTYSIPTIDGSEPTELTSICENLGFVKLETTKKSLIQNVGKVYMNENFIFIGDPGQKCVFVFKKDGTFYNKIASHGKGKEEIQGLTDYYVDNIQENIIIWDNGNRKRITYDFKGNFINSTRVGYTNKFTKMNNGNYLLYVGKRKEFALNIYNPKNKKLKELLKINPTHIGIPEPYGVNFFNKHSNGSISFIYTLDPVVYDVDESGVSPKYYMEFGKKDINTFFEKEYVSEKEKKALIRKSGLPYNFCDYNESNSKILFSYLINRKAYYSIIDKGSETVMSFHKWVLVDEINKDFFMYLYLHNNELWGIVDGYTLWELYVELTDDKKKILKNRIPELDSIIASISPSDNPIFIRMSLDKLLKDEEN